MRQNSAQLIADFVAVAALAGHTIRAEDIRHEFVPAPHARPQLPRGTSAVYVFSLASDESVVLKVGKVGPKSAARFGSQHYLPASAKSNLATWARNQFGLDSEFPRWTRPLSATG